nr:DNA-directed RNA polymerase II subunit RPB1-like isoform X2 [Megalopta genalis]
MMVSAGKDSRVFRACGALLIVFGLASGSDLAQSPSPSIEYKEGNATVVKLEKTIGTVIDEGKQPLARDVVTSAPTIASKSVKGVGWKIGRASSHRDSYLEALSHSRTSSDPREGVVSADGTGPAQRRKEYAGPVYTGKDSEIGATHPRIVYGSPDRDTFSMVPSNSYSLPTRGSADFAGFQNAYGQSQSYPQSYPQSQPPRATYGAPSHSYPPTSYEYLPPQQAYGPPAPTYGVPHGSSETPSFVLPTIDFSWPFALKLNAFTLAKILLKLVIFKMIVKFIAVICLLLFIPKLEIKKKGNKPMNNNDDDDDDDDEGRRSLDGNPRFWRRLNELAAFASDALGEYESLNNVDRSGTVSRSSRGQLLGETWYDYSRLLHSYALEEMRYTRAKS